MTMLPGHPMFCRTNGGAGHLPFAAAINWKASTSIAVPSFSSDLGSESAQASFVGARGNAVGQLVTKALRELPLPPDSRGVVDFLVRSTHAHRCAKLFFRQPLHADQEAALVSVTAGPLFDLRVDLPPATEVEVPDAEVAALRKAHGFGEGREEVVLDVVENLRHCGVCSAAL